MPTRLFLAAITCVLCFAAGPAKADPTMVIANLSYATNTGWSFDTGAMNGRILIDRPTSRKLSKLDHITVHLCSIVYEPDSKLAAANGDFYAVLRITKCN